MFCVNCGSPYDVAHRYCNKCGHATTEINSPLQNLATKQESEALLPADPPNPTRIPADQGEVAASESRDFYLLALWLILATFALFFLTCAIAINVTNSRHGFGLALVSLIGMFVFFVLAIRDFRRQRGLQPAQWAPASAGRIVFNGGVFALLLGGLGVALGIQIGASGSATEAYLADMKKFNQYGDRVTESRNAAPETISGQIAMYSSISADVTQLKPVADRLISEAHEYEGRYPAAKKIMDGNIAVFQKTSSRCNFLEREIRIADDIASMPPDLQVQAWRERMIPALKDEDSLDAH